jgi:hypothetical protein
VKKRYFQFLLSPFNEKYPMSLIIKAKLVKILSQESGVARTGNQWKKQEFVVETQDQFPKKVCFTLFNDKVNLLNGINEGEELEISFDIESREFNNKWYHNLNAWKIERMVHKVETSFQPPFSEADIPAEPFTGEPDDLPF